MNTQFFARGLRESTHWQRAMGEQFNGSVVHGARTRALDQII
jgi:hypothetical protein